MSIRRCSAVCGRRQWSGAHSVITTRQENDEQKDTKRPPTPADRPLTADSAPPGLTAPGITSKLFIKRLIN